MKLYDPQSYVLDFLWSDVRRDCAVYEAAFSELRIAFRTFSPLKLSLYTIPNGKRYFYDALEDREQPHDLSPHPLDLCRFPEVYGFELVDTFEPDKKGVIFSDIDYRANNTIAHFDVKSFHDCAPYDVIVLKNDNIWGQAAVKQKLVLDCGGGFPLLPRKPLLIPLHEIREQFKP